VRCSQRSRGDIVSIWGRSRHQRRVIHMLRHRSPVVERSTMTGESLRSIERSGVKSARRTAMETYTFDAEKGEVHYTHGGGGHVRASMHQERLAHQ
jgi:hypothetical protein